jgi:polyisoprenoid-binding protein YceI
MTMKKTVLFLGILFLAIYSVSAQEETKWGFDKAHSKIQFDVAHMVISEVSGQFQEYEGTVVTSKDDFSDARIDFSIDVKSIDTDSEDRDKHLRSTDFFDVGKYPKITFSSNEMKKMGDNLYQLSGDLTLHGVTKKVILDVKYGGTIKDSYGNVKAGFKITGVIDRTDYGLKYNSVMDTGGMLIGEDVTITCKVELIKI